MKVARILSLLPVACLAEALKQEAADVRYVEFPGVGHNAWDRAFGDEALWEWLFQQRRAVR